MHSSWLEDADPKIKFKITESGWMENCSFEDWFSNVQSKEAFKRAHAVSGFDSTGIFPLDRSRVPKEKLLINKTFQHVVSARTAQETDSDDESSDLNETGEYEPSNHVMHYGRSDSDEEPSSQIVLDRPSISQPRSSSPLRSLSPAPSQSDLNTELLNNFLSTQLSKASKPSSIHITDRVKRARLVGPGGACITSTESQSILEAEVNERLQRKIDADRVKQEREIKRRKLDAAAIRKKELASIKKKIKREKLVTNVQSKRNAIKIR